MEIASRKIMHHSGLSKSNPHQNYQYSEDEKWLTAAWARFKEYDNAAIHQKRRSTDLRKLIILLGFLISFFAVAGIYLPQFQQGFGLLVVVMSLSIGGAMAYASRFEPSLAWISARIAAELIRREIYLYRLCVSEYGSDELKDQRKTIFYSNLEEKVFKEITQICPSQPDTELIINQSLNDIVETDHDEDHGCKDMTIDEYITQRVIPQQKWYIDRSRKDRRAQRVWWWTMWVANSFLSVLLAGIGLGPLAAVATAGASAASLYMGLMMYGQTYLAYRQTAKRLRDQVDSWDHLSESQQKDNKNIKVFVEGIENIFHQERLAWLERAIEAQSVIEQDITKYTIRLGVQNGQQLEPDLTEPLSPVTSQGSNPGKTISSESIRQ